MWEVRCPSHTAWDRLLKRVILQIHRSCHLDESAQLYGCDGGRVSGLLRMGGGSRVRLNEERASNVLSGKVA